MLSVQKKLNNRGFSLVELLVAIGLAAIFLPALVNVFSFSLGSARQGENYTRAYASAQKEMEAIINLKDNDVSWDWDINPQNNSANDYYQPRLNNGVYSLGSKTTSPAEENGMKSSVQILPVFRVGGNIDQNAGDLDPTTRKVIARVEWQENGVPTQIELVSYVTKH